MAQSFPRGLAQSPPRAGLGTWREMGAWGDPAPVTSGMGDYPRGPEGIGRTCSVWIGRRLERIGRAASWGKDWGRAFSEESMWADERDPPGATFHGVRALLGSRTLWPRDRLNPRSGGISSWGYSGCRSHPVTSERRDLCRRSDEGGA